MAPVPGTTVSLGTTLYSYSNEWVARRYTLDQLVAEVAAAGTGPGVEIVGFQSIRNFPRVDRDFADHWRGLLDRHGLEPTCLGANIDVALRSDRWLDTDEMTDYLSAQIDAAKLLGFPVLRIQMGATAEVIERATPLAEKAGVTLGMEIHAPEGATTPAMVQVRELYDRLQSERLGFIPDFSSTMHAVPEGFGRLATDAGVSADLIEELKRVWARDGAPLDRFNAWADLARERGTEESAIGRCQLAFTMFGHESMGSWAEIADRIVHVHGKFYDIVTVDGEAVEPSIDYRAAMKLLVDHGYQGYISSEWEGHSWHDAGEADVTGLIRRHHAVETAALQEAARQGAAL